MSKSHSHFDFIEAASRGYLFAWDKRSALLHLAFLPITIKFISLMLLILFELQDNYLRQGLILLPSYFAEGWLVAQTVRLTFVSNDSVLAAPHLRERFKNNSFEMNQRILMATVILYTLVMMISTMALGTMASAVPTEAVDAEVPEADGNMMLFAFMLVTLMIWGFRFLWLYIPVALGYGLKAFILKMKPFMLSIYMIATWLICIIPIGLVTVMLSQMAVAAFGVSDGVPTNGYFVSMYFIRAFVEALVAIITTVAMGYAIVRIMEGDAPEKTGP